METAPQRPDPPEPPPTAEASGDGDPACTAQMEAPFVLLVEDDYTLSGRGVAVVGTVLMGEAEAPDEMSVLSLEEFMLSLLRAPTAERRERALSTAVEIFGSQHHAVVQIMREQEEVARAAAGQQVGLVLRGLERERVAPNDLVLGEGFAEYFGACPYLIPER